MINERNVASHYGSRVAEVAKEKGWLSASELAVIETMLDEGWVFAGIAKRLGQADSAVSREVAANRWLVARIGMAASWNGTSDQRPAVLRVGILGASNAPSSASRSIRAYLGMSRSMWRASVVTLLRIELAISPLDSECHALGLGREATRGVD